MEAETKPTAPQPGHYAWSDALKKGADATREAAALWDQAATMDQDSALVLLAKANVQFEIGNVHFKGAIRELRAAPPAKGAAP